MIFYYKVENLTLENIAKSRNWIAKGETPDTERTAIYLGREIRSINGTPVAEVVNAFRDDFSYENLVMAIDDYLGNKLNVDIYLAAIVVFVGRMFTNLAIIRRYYIDKYTAMIEEKRKSGKKKKEAKVTEE